mgnify:CR=1 FL=1
MELSGRRLLVSDADERKALSIIRSLAPRGVSVYAADCSKRASSFYSRYCSERAVYRADVEKEPWLYVKEVARLLEAFKVDVFFPVSTEATLATSFFKEDLEDHAKVPVADYSKMLRAHDKYSAIKTAEEVGVPVPKTECPRSLDEVGEAASHVGLPLVIKARMYSGVRKGVRYVDEPAKLLKSYMDIHSRGSGDNIAKRFANPILQEFIPGEIHDVCVLFNHGEPRAVLTQLRLKTVPPKGGPGVVNITTDVPILKEYAVRLMEALEWHGVAQLEFKRDPRDGLFKLIEINPKFWGTLQLSIEAGVDFPYMLFKMALEGDVEPRYEYRKGLTYVWLLDAAEYVLSSSSKFKALRSVALDILRGVDDFYLKDAGPSLVKWSLFTLSLLRRLGGG